MGHIALLDTVYSDLPSDQKTLPEFEPLLRSPCAVHSLGDMGEEAVLTLPETEATPLIRTDFKNEEAWREVVQSVASESDLGFRANLSIVEDLAFDGADPDVLANLAQRTTSHALLVVADSRTMADAERTLLCIDPLPPGGTFRVVPAELWGVENNVSLANMDFAEFASATAADGVFRGFTD